MCKNSNSNIFCQRTFHAHTIKIIQQHFKKMFKKKNALKKIFPLANKILVNTLLKIANQINKNLCCSKKFYDYVLK